MYLQTDLELPHVPHLTTITSTIVPTATLAQWRTDHHHRYSTRLSDYSSTEQRSSTQSSGVRNRKGWMIENTMYVSSRDGGTRPFRRISAKEFHEMQWNQQLGHQGRLVEHRSVELQDTSLNTDTDNLSTTRRDSAPYTHPTESSLGRRSHLGSLISKFRPWKRLSQTSEKTAWLKGMTELSTAASLRDLLDVKPTPLVHEWEIPNAIFARKFGLFADTHTLPTSIKELPVAEDKIVDHAAESPVRGLVTWRFQGPFTPQLWFDSGLDYRWRRK